MAIPRSICALVALPFLITACSAGTATEQQPAGGGRGNAGGGPVPITTGLVSEKPVPLQITAIGAGEPYSTVSVHAQLTGELTAVHFNEGDDVREGQVLFELDRRPLETALVTSAGKPRPRYRAGGQRTVASRRAIRIWPNAASRRAISSIRRKPRRRRSTRRSRPTGRRSKTPKSSCNTPRSRLRSPDGRARSWCTRATSCGRTMRHRWWSSIRCRLFTSRLRFPNRASPN